MSFEDWASREVQELSLDLKPRRPAPHQSIFKYIGLNTKTSWAKLERTLNDCELTGSTQTALNDPFELSPYLFNDLRPATIAKALGKGPSLSDILHGKVWDPEDIFSDVGKYKAEAEAAFAKVQGGARVVAFCERSDSPLLWSHYAHSYQGACLHFIGSAFDQHRVNFGAVTYSSHRPTYPLSLALRLSAARDKDRYPSDDLARTESNKLVFFTKAADWAYEREVRIVYDVARQSAASFKPDGLLSIIVGPRTSVAHIKRLKDLIKRSRVPHLPLRKAELSTNSFSVEIA